MTKRKVLEVNNLNLELNKTKILKDFSFDLNEGEVFAVIGPNGCGKSSLAYTLMGLNGYEENTGEIKLNGEKINGLATNKIAQKGMTLAWQEPARYEGVTVRKFLSLGLESQGKEVTEKELSEALEEVAIVPGKYLNRKIDDTLSGGERKRIELASILLMDPDVVILDEPDSGVDVVALNNISQVIDDFREKGTGVILITHNEEMLQMADRSVLVCNGEILKRGAPEDISRYFKFECVPCEDENYQEHLEVSSLG